MIVPKGFLPTEDQGRFNVSVEGIQGIGFDEMVRHQQEVAAILAQDPDIAGFSSSIGVGGGDERRWRTSNQGRISVDLKPRAERKRSVDQIMARSAAEAGAGARRPRVHGQSAAHQHWRAGRSPRAPISSRFRNRIPPELYRRRRMFEEEMRNIESIEDVNSDLRLNNPQIQINLNRDRIAALGLTVNQVETALFNAYGTRQVSQIYAASNQYQVILQVAPEFQQDPAALAMLYVRSTSGKLIPLNTVATVTTGVGPCR